MIIMDISKNIVLRPTKQQALQMELKLNTSQWGRTWSHIGDKLYDYSIDKTDLPPALIVTSAQFKFLSELIDDLKVESISKTNAI